MDLRNSMGSLSSALPQVANAQLIKPFIVIASRAMSDYMTRSLLIAKSPGVVVLGKLRVFNGFIGLEPPEPM